MPVDGNAENKHAMAPDTHLDLRVGGSASVQLRDSEEFNRSLMNATPDCIKVLDTGGRLLHMNAPGLCAMEIVDFSTVCGQPWESIWPSTAKPDIERSLHKALGGEVSSFQAYCPTARGVPKWWEVTVSPVRETEGGRVVRLLAVSRDITHQREAAEDQARLLLQLEEAHGRMADVFRQAPAFMCVLRGPQHVFEMSNERYDHLLGHRNLLGLPVREAIPEVVGQGFFELLDKVYETGEPFVGVGVRVVLNRGAEQLPEVRYIDFVYQALKDATGATDGIAVVGVDVTERQLADERLRASEERLRLALDAADLGTWQIHAESNTLVCDERFRIIFTGQVGPITHEESVARIHPDDRDRISDAMAMAMRADQPVPYSEQYRVMHLDGLIRWVHGKGRVSVETTNAGKQITSLNGTVMDITFQKFNESQRKEIAKALRDSEERMRAATTAVSDVIWTNTADGLMRGQQQGWEDFTGQSREEYQDYGWSKAVHPDDAQPTIDAWARAVAEKRTFVFEHRVRRHDDQWRLCAIRAVPILNADKTIREWVGVHADITERKRDEEQLRQLAADLSEASHRKDEFLATLAHELRNPLAPIRNGLQLMKLEGGHSETQEKTRSMMERQLTQMVRLVDDLLDVSRIDQGKLELRKERVSLATVLNSAVETSRPLIEEMGHALTITLPEHPIFVDCDITRLAQVFLNLLNNAAKYTKRGGHIQLKVELRDREVLVTVKDDGIGIAANDLPRIFEMFKQVVGSSERSQAGLGIGLTLVKQLVEMHGGRVGAKSEGIRKGSEFAVHLPTRVEAPQPEADHFDDAPQVSNSSLRILVVDDSRDSADTMAKMLELLGNDTRTAYDGQQGVDVANEFRPDVILFDIGMPKLNGYEACRLIRGQTWGEKTVVIAMTGWGQEKDKDRTREAGFDHHLVKPVDPHVLVQMLASFPPRTLSPQEN